VMASSGHLKKGEKGRIIARVSTVMKKGPVNETISVVTNDPAHQRVVLTLQATVREKETFLPAAQPDVCK